MRVYGFVVALVALSVWCASAAGQQRAGRLPDGAAILPSGWALTPAGRQIELGTLPMALQLSPDGQRAYVLETGFLPPALRVVDLSSQTVSGTLALPDAWLGLTLNRTGDKAFVGGGGRGVVLEVALSGGAPTLSHEYKAVAERRDRDFIGDVLLSADEGLLYAANLLDDSVSVLNAKSGIRLSSFRTGSRPYRMRLGLDGETAWISHWGGSSLGLYSLATGRQIDSVLTGPLPGDFLLVKGAVETPEEDGPPIVARLFVACSNTNSVWVFGLTADQSPRLLERIELAPTPIAPAGTEPAALALSPDGKTLAIVAKGNNFVALADISGARSTLLGAVPTGWQPTAAALHPDGRLLYLNGKGGGSRPNPLGPDPTRRDKPADYVAALETGSLGILPKVSEEQLAGLTLRAAENILYDDAFAVAPPLPPDSPLAGPSSPIQHVVLVITENRSYDQLFGDLPGGEGDPKLTLFGDDTAPNRRRLAREFVLFDNFYATGSVSADGLAQTTAAFANDFLEKLWPARYARRLSIDPFGPAEPAVQPPAGYLWSNALAAGLSVRNYGLSPDVSLEGHTDAEYPGFDLQVRSAQRVERFLADFGQRKPRLSLVYLPNDHTAGRAPGARTPRAMIAEHDLALGRLVEGLSQAPSWERTAVFIVSDDAQDGADHIDAHRSVLLVASPWVRRGVVDSTFYSTHSVLRTIELILGLRPMTQLDAAATPLGPSFQSKADAKPYQAGRPAQSLDETNPAGEGAAPRRVEAVPTTLQASL
ncbi:MAG: hypothetical protein GC160_23605 [Acidobacteria bacterium]|nr:hypothetical protein [Acidobacteriota bacterium]